MLIVTMNQYLRLGLEALCGEPEKDSHTEPVIFIPERSGDIYIYTRSNGENDSLMLFLSVQSSWRIVKDSKNKGTWGVLEIPSGLFVNRKQRLCLQARARRSGGVGGRVGAVLVVGPAAAGLQRRVRYRHRVRRQRRLVAGHRVAGRILQGHVARRVGGAVRRNGRLLTIRRCGYECSR